MAYLELLLDLPPEVLPQLVELLGEGGVGEVGLDPILDGQLVEEAEWQIVVLKQTQQLIIIVVVQKEN